MGSPGITVIEEQIEWAQDKILYAAITHITDNFDSFPVLGMGFSFMKRSAEKMIIKRMEQNIVPEIDEHIQIQIAFIKALLETDDPTVVEDEYQEKLLDTDPFLRVLDTTESKTNTFQEQVIAHHRSVAHDTVEWLREAGDEEYEDYADLVVRTGKTGEDVEQEIRDMMQYIEWLEEHHEHIDLSRYSSLLEQETVHDWFLNALIDGLKSGREDVITELLKQITERENLE